MSEIYFGGKDAVFLHPAKGNNAGHLKDNFTIFGSRIDYFNAEFVVLGASRLAWLTLGSRCRVYVEFNRYFNGNLQRNGMHGPNRGITVNT